jgi:hypothetical protein
MFETFRILNQLLISLKIGQKFMRKSHGIKYFMKFRVVILTHLIDFILDIKKNIETIYPLSGIRS